MQEKLPAFFLLKSGIQFVTATRPMILLLWFQNGQFL